MEIHLSFLVSSQKKVIGGTIVCKKNRECLQSHQNTSFFAKNNWIKSVVALFFHSCSIASKATKCNFQKSYPDVCRKFPNCFWCNNFCQNYWRLSESKMYFSAKQTLTDSSFFSAKNLCTLASQEKLKSEKLI